jgi:predicted nucleic acid-binding protein
MCQDSRMCSLDIPFFKTLSPDSVPWARPVRGSRPPIVPGLFFAECANILWKKVARRELAADDALKCGHLLAAARLRIVSDAQLFMPALELACELGHPAYDCVYLALAHAEGVPLVTSDLRLIERCGQSGHQWLRELVRPLQ